MGENDCEGKYPPPIGKGVALELPMTLEAREELRKEFGEDY